MVAKVREFKDFVTGGKGSLENCMRFAWGLYPDPVMTSHFDPTMSGGLPCVTGRQALVNAGTFMYQHL